MSRHIRALAASIAITASLATIAAVSAQSGSGVPQPLPSQPPLSPPPPPPSNLGPSIRPDILGLPFGFHFADEVFGSGFKAGERVTITMQKVTASPVSAVADANGSFTAQVSFTWMFCGPHGTQQAPPVIVATGSQGSADHFTLYAPQCPTLAPQEEDNGVSPPPPGGSSGGGVVASGTAVAVPATVVTAPVGSASGASQASTPIPAAVPAPRAATFDVQGFGFAPGEHVTVQESFGAFAVPPALHEVADEQGRLSFTAKAYVPGHCSMGPIPQLVATGDAGTTVAVPLPWRDLVMSPCAEAGGVIALGTPPPPGAPAPASALATPPPPSAGAANTPISISLHPSIARRGKTEKAVVQATGLQTVHLTVRYPGQRSTTLTANAGASGRVTLHWRIPSSVRVGKAHGQLTVDPGSRSLRLTFTVR